MCQHWHYWCTGTRICLRVHCSCVGRCLLVFPFAPSVMIVVEKLDSLPASSSPECGNLAQQSVNTPSSQSQNSIRPSPPPYVNYQTIPQSVTASASVERSRPAERRFFKALLVAISIWVLVGIFVSPAFGLHDSTRRVSFRQESLGSLGLAMLKTEHREG